MSFVADLSALVSASADHRHSCPEGWSRVPLGSVAKIVNGFPFKSGGFGMTGHPVIRIRDVTRGFTNTRFDGDAPAGFWVETGDLIVGMDGDFQTAFWRSDAALLNQRVCKVVPDQTRIDRRYLAYILPGYLELINANTPSVTVKHLSSKTLASIPLPLPPLDRQIAIADRIDELLAELDDGEAALARARDDLGTWRKALLKAAVTGELTAGWRAANLPAETGADLLTRILAERRARWVAEPKNKGKHFKQPALFSGPVPRDLPAGWVWASVEQIGDVVTGNTPPASDRQAYDGDVPFFTPGDLDAGFALDGTRRTLGPSGLARSREVPPRSVLVTCIGATVGKVGFNAKVGATNQQINTIIPAEAGLAEFLFHYFDGPGRQLVVEGASSTTMPIINKGDFSRLPVPVPPLAEAVEVSRMVQAMVGEAEIGRVEMTSMTSLTAALRQSILAAAFHGELV